MSSSTPSTSTPARTQTANQSTPSRVPSSGSNHDASADVSHAHPLPSSGGGGGGGGGGDHFEDAASTTSDNIASAAAAAAAATLPALPAPDHASTDGASTTTLQVDGKAVVLDHLGPMVVGRDGTVSRIANWDELSEIERRNTLRILGKRNQVRLAALRAGSQNEAEG